MNYGKVALAVLCLFGGQINFASEKTRDDNYLFGPVVSSSEKNDYYFFGPYFITTIKKSAKEDNNKELSQCQLRQKIKKNSSEK